MRKEEFTFESRNGKTNLYACAFYPEKEPLCIVQIVHGMKDHMGRYEKLAKFLTERGIIVVGEDHLGHGKTVKEGETFGYFCENDGATVLVRDVHRLKKIMEQKYPSLPYILLGHSMGSFIVRNYLGKYGTGIAGAILCGTGTPSKAELRMGQCLTKTIGALRGSKYVSKLVDNISKKGYMSGVEGATSKHAWLSTDEEVLDVYANDPFCSGYKFTVNGYHTMFELAIRMQKKEYLNNIPKKLPILIASGTDDPVGQKGLAPKKLYDEYLNLDMTKVTLKLYGGARHEILNEKVSETVFMDLHSWIERVAMESLGK